MFDDLTNGARKTLAILYRAYTEKLKNNCDIFTSSIFGSSVSIQKNLMPNSTPENVDHWCRELHRNGYLNCLFANNIASETLLTDQAIREMENRFRKGAKEVTDFIAKLIP